MKTFDHSIDLDKTRYHEREDMIQWCRDNIGRGGYIPHDYNVWEIDTIFGNSTFRFRNQQDAVLFALRWL